MPLIDRIAVVAVLGGTLGLSAARAISSWIAFRQERRTEELLERAIAELERERVGERR